ncbi:MAG: hypothetical protein KIG91_00905 [Treponema sp.]|nr:hypothetical protein [Treponema sp.]
MNDINELLSEFLDKDTVGELSNFLNKAEKYEKAADKIAVAFGSKSGFSKITPENALKLSHSFKNNLTLLIQKTWVEKSDIALKDKLLYELEQFSLEDSKKWTERYPLFLSLIDDAVFLMFGKQAKSEDFLEYSLRIDPEFGIFWWYIGSLPKECDWSEEKCRLAVLLGMYFLANY